MSKELTPLPQSEPSRDSVDSEEPRRASIWSWPDATPGARAAAFVLDCLVIGAMWGLMQVFCDRFFDAWVADAAQALGLIAYLIGFQLGRRRTIGQRAVGLKLIGFDAQDIDDGVPLLRLVLREFVYFPLGLLALGFGVLMSLLRKDRMALHDLLSRTRMVALAQEPSSEPVRLSVVLSVLAGVGMVGTLGFMSVLYWTPYPLRSTVHSLELLGYRFGRISGTLSSGFRIERVAFDNEEFSLDLHDVRFRYENGDNGTKVENLTVGKGEISFHKALDGFQWPSVNLRLTVDSADMKNITFQWPARPPLVFKRVFFSEIELDQHMGAVTMDRIWIDSEAVAADIQDFIWQGRAIGTSKPSHLTIKPALDADLIAAPIDLTFEGFYQDGVYDKFYVEACRGRVKLMLNGRGGEMTVSGFTPAHFLRTELPLWNFNVNAKLDFLHGKITEARGSVDLRNFRFAIEGGAFRYQRGQRQYLIELRAPEDWAAVLDGGEAAAHISASELKSVKAILADVYYQLPAASLSTSETEMVDHDQRYFGLAPADEGASTSESLRAPTSEKH